jgi:hypothetical protein
MLGELRRKATPTARVLGPQALRVAAFRKLASIGGHADRFRVVGLAAHAFCMLRLLLRFGAIAHAGNDQRSRKMRVPQSEMQCGVSSHREPDDMRRRVGDRTYDIGEIIGGSFLAVSARIRGNARRRVAARAIDRATEETGKIADLRIPTAGIAGELVHEDERLAAPAETRVQHGSVRCDDAHGSHDLDIIYQRWHWSRSFQRLSF